MAATLTATAKCQVESASRSTVVDEFSALSINFSNDQFIPTTNSLGTDTINKIKNGSFTEAEMNQYIAASTITHLQDSWNFLGQAIQATLNGQASIAKHLGYYAELRASMSILATEGIGIFNKAHYYIDNADSTPKKIDDRNGTHQALWLILEHWSEQDQARGLLERIITPQNIKLENWVNSYRNNTWSSLSSQIFKQWGVDLQYLAKDRDTRNRVSYRPTYIHSHVASDFKQNYQFVVELWNLLEPSNNGNYPNIDNLLLVQTINLLNPSSNPKSRNQLNKDLYKMLDSNLTSLQQKKDYMNYFHSSPNNPVLTNAETIHSDIDSAMLDPLNHLQVIARALLLVRIATGAVKLLLQDSNVNLTDIDFWTKHIMTRSGLTSLEEMNHLSFEDLWSDIHDIAINDINQSIDEANDLYDYKNDYSHASVLLSECQRAMLWGLSS